MEFVKNFKLFMFIIAVRVFSVEVIDNNETKRYFFLMIYIIFHTREMEIVKKSRKIAASITQLSTVDLQPV